MFAAGGLLSQTKVHETDVDRNLCFTTLAENENAKSNPVSSTKATSSASPIDGIDNRDGVFAVRITTTAEGKDNSYLDVIRVTEDRFASTVVIKTKGAAPELSDEQGLIATTQAKLAAISQK